MKIIIMGGGIIGVSTAWYLAQHGCEVLVLDRQGQVGLETSFANGGQIAPGQAAPWAAAGIPLKAFKWLFSRHSPLVMRPDWSLHQINFLRMMLANCNSEAYSTNKSNMTALSQYSLDQFKQLRSQIGITYEDRQRGILKLF